MGAPASGKGTQGEILSDYTNLPVVSMGQTLRDVPKEHIWHELINEQMRKGKLVDQEKAAQILKEKLSKPEYGRGFIIDGWFRSMKDVTLYDPGFDVAILLNIDPEEIVKRMSNRRVCKECGDVYNLTSNPPKIEGVCDECGGILIQRDDDKEETVRARIKSFEEETSEVLTYLGKKGILKKVDGIGSLTEVNNRIKLALGI